MNYELSKSSFGLDVFGGITCVRGVWSTGENLGW